MNAFATAMNVIFADRNMAVDAIWFAGATGPAVAIRVIRKSPDEITPFGAGRILSETTMLDARIVDMPTPAPGDMIRIGPEDFILQGEPKLDRDRLIWTLKYEDAMKLNISFTPDLVALMRAEVAAGQKAVSITMAQAGAGLKSAWRGQITGAGLGQRLANTIRSQTYPKGRNSLDAAALVWSNAPVIIGAHDTGPLIRSGSGFWLAIPLPAAGKALGGKRITPAMWEQKTGLRLRFVYRSRGPSLLVADAVRMNTRGQAAVSKSKTGKGQVTAPIFLLVRQVKLPKRLDLMRDAERAQAAIPGSIVRNWVEDHL